MTKVTLAFLDSILRRLYPFVTFIPKVEYADDTSIIIDMEAYSHRRMIPGDLSSYADTRCSSTDFRIVITWNVSEVLNLTIRGHWRSSAFIMFYDAGKDECTWLKDGHQYIACPQPDGEELEIFAKEFYHGVEKTGESLFKILQKEFNYLDKDMLKEEEYQS
jgi:hypothetical protein